MRGIWFEEHERLWNESEGEPDEAAVSEAVIERISYRADRLRDEWKERDL